MAGQLNSISQLFMSSWVFINTLPEVVLHLQSYTMLREELCLTLGILTRQTNIGFPTG